MTEQQFLNLAAVLDLRVVDPPYRGVALPTGHGLCIIAPLDYQKPAGEERWRLYHIEDVHDVPDTIAFADLVHNKLQGVMKQENISEARNFCFESTPWQSGRRLTLNVELR